MVTDVLNRIQQTFFEKYRGLRKYVENSAYLNKFQKLWFGERYKISD